MANFDPYYERDAGVYRTPYVAEHTEEFESILTRYQRPGFFTPFKSGKDVLLQIKAPIAMPIIGLFRVANEVIILAKNFSVGIINLLSGNLDKTWYSTNAFLQALFNIGDYLLTTVIDTLWELITLITRTVASCFYGAVAGVDAIHGYFATTETPSETTEEVELIAADLEHSQDESSNEEHEKEPAEERRINP